MSACARFTIGLLAVFATVAAVAADKPTAAAQPQRVLILVDQTVKPELDAGLNTYMDHVRAILPIDFKILTGDLYAKQPWQIREMLATEYRDANVPVVGAIMVGPIPHALRGKPDWPHYSTPVPLYYEDFDAVWYDDDNDGWFDRVDTDRTTNATEIWTAWWVPPANEHAEQVELLKSWLGKLDRYYRGEMTGRDGCVYIAGNGNSVEITESWTILMNMSMESTGNEVAKIFSRLGEMPNAVHPEGGHFKPDDLQRVLEQGSYQHVHTVTHGTPAGFYMEQSAISGTELDLERFDAAGANIFTTSGCSNANFRGRNFGALNYAKSVGNRLLFSPNTLTIAYYGATSPQSTGVFAMVHTELFEYLDPAKGSYIADGYRRIRNRDVTWGTMHYVFRGLDGKALLGDPFARYRPAPSQPRQAAAGSAVEAAQ